MNFISFYFIVPFLCSHFSHFFYCVCKLKMQILFLTFDPPDPPVQGVPGHFCVIALNMVKERFELLDSLRGPFDTDGLRVLHTMATNIQKLWRQSTNSQGHSFNPRSIDHFPYAYVRAPKQTNT